jgi:hypothetical protein
VERPSLATGAVLAPAITVGCAGRAAARSHGAATGSGTAAPVLAGTVLAGTVLAGTALAATAAAGLAALAAESSSLAGVGRSAGQADDTRIGSQPAVVAPAAGHASDTDDTGGADGTDGAGG